MADSRGQIGSFFGEDGAGPHFFRVLAENSPDVVYSVSCDGIVTYVGPQARCYGYEPEEILSRHFLEFVAPEDREMVGEDFARVLRTGEGSRTEFRMLRKDGGVFWVEDTGFVLRDETGEVVGLAGALRDITERKRAEAGFKAILQESLQGVAVFGPGPRILLANETFASMGEYSVGELLEMPPEEVRGLVHPDDRELVWGRLARRLRGETPEVRYQFRGVTRSGRVVWLDMRVASIDFMGIPAVQAAIVDISDMKQAEEALRRQHDLLTLITETVPIGIVLFDARGALSFVNSRAEDILAVKRSEAVGKRLEETSSRLLSPEGDVPGPEGLPFEAARRAGRPVTDLRFRVERGERGDRFVSANAAPLYSEDGALYGVVASFEDVTLQVRAEEAVRASEERYRELFENMTSGLAVFRAVEGGADFEVKDFNPAAERIEGLSRDAVIGKRISEEFRDEMLGDFLEIVKKVWEEGGAVHLPAFFRKGRRITGWRECHIFRLPTGEVVAVFNDISDRMRALEELRRSEERFRSTFDLAAIGKVMTDREGRIVQVNDAYCRMLGYSRSELQEKSIADLCHPEDVRANREVLQALVSGDSGSACLETRLLHESGRVVWVFLSAAAVKDALGNVEYMIGDVVDITSRKRLEAEILQVQKMEAVGRLAGGLAHDFNNLLTVILGSAQLLLHEAPPSVPWRKRVESINEAALRGQSLTGQLLAFSRQQRVSPIVFSLSHLVKGLRTLLHSVLGEDVELVFSLCPGSDFIKADPSQMERLIINLAVNAREAMPRGGTFAVSVKPVDVALGPGVRGPSGKCVELVVSDTGSGMDETTLSRAFEPFFSTKRDKGNSGLGLSVVYGIASEAGGSVSVESRPGEGTTFRILFPMVSRKEGPKALPLSEKRKRKRRRGAGPGSSVLLVEDNDGVREYLKDVLDGDGFRVTDVATPAEAVRVFERDSARFDFLVTDIRMPGMNGERLAGLLREMRPGLPVLFISGYSEASPSKECLSMPRTAFLKKPFTPDAFLSALEELGGMS